MFLRSRVDDHRDADDLSAGLLGTAAASLPGPTGAAAAEEEAPMPEPVPLRFWIALTLSATVVGFLATMGSLYGVFLTDSLRR